MYIPEEFCTWAETTFNDQEKPITLCHHPLMAGFCNYVDLAENKWDYEECHYLQTTWEEPSRAEEEVRQYLEYTEQRSSISAADQAEGILRRYQKKEQ